MKIVEARNENIARRALSNKDTDMLISAEKYSGKDYMHSRNSGLDSVFCNLAYKNQVAIGFNFDDVLFAEDRAKILGKMMLNVKLCRKSKAKMIIYSAERKNLNDLKAFGILIGMTGSEAKKAVEQFKKQRDIEVL